MRSIGCLLLLCATALGEPKVTPLAGHALGYAYWTFDGAAFYVLARDGARLERFAADGTPRGSVSLPAEVRALAAYLRAPNQASRAVSPDGKRLAFAAIPSGIEQHVYVLGLADQKLESILREGHTSAVEWLADGRLLTTTLTDALGVLAWSSGKTPQPFCPQYGAYAVHAHPDGRHVAIAGAQLMMVRLDCGEPRALTPPPADPKHPDHPDEFAFSPSGARAAVQMWLHAGDEDEQRLWIVDVAGGAHVEADRSLKPASNVVWLDEDTVIYHARDGRRPVLMRYSVAANKAQPLVAPRAGCLDAMQSAPPRGGRVVFAHTCDDEQDSYEALVTP